MHRLSMRRRLVIIGAVPNVGLLQLIREIFLKEREKRDKNIKIH